MVANDHHNHFKKNNTKKCVWIAADIFASMFMYLQRELPPPRLISGWVC